MKNIFCSLIKPSILCTFLNVLILNNLCKQGEASFLIPTPKALVEFEDKKLDNEDLQISSYYQNDTLIDPQVTSESASGITSDKRMFVIELLKMLHEQYSIKKATVVGPSKKLDMAGPSIGNRQLILTQLMNAISADGDVRRLVDWIQNSFNLASVGELTTQFVVGKLGSVNCAALLKPDNEETLIPRFLLFNEHFTDVPFELPIKPSATECIANGHFDPQRKTVVLIHGYLAGYTLVDSITNIKNRLLDLNRVVNDRALRAFIEASRNNNSYVLTEDLETKVRSQQQNVIIVDWFQGANPVPRSRYIRAAVNAQVVGELIARFLSSLVTKCKTLPSNIQLIAHSLGCHVAGFTGKAMLARGQQLGKITHLDPIGLCFGRLFSQPRFRLNPNDAIETQAVHVSLNIFDNPLDGVHSNFLVNGGRDQIGCGGQSEVKNSTSSSVALLYDTNSKFRPCSHMRAPALFEDDLSSEPEQCQIVGYKCANYERFLAGKCGKCDALNNQCRLMSLPPISSQFKRLPTFSGAVNRSAIAYQVGTTEHPTLLDTLNKYSNGTIAWLVHDKEINHKIGKAIGSKLRKSEEKITKRSEEEESFGARAGRTSTGERLVRTLDRIRTDAVNAIAEGWSNFKSAEYKITSSFTNPTAIQFANPLITAEVINTPVEEDSASSSVQVDESKDIYEVPIGSQQIPGGSQNSPLYFVGTGPVSPYCVNYYQFRLLIAESRLKRILEGGGLKHKRQPTSDGWSQATISSNPAIDREATISNDQLHMTIKLTDSKGRFFKGFTLQENSRTLTYAPKTESLLVPPGKLHGEPMIELTMLLNTTTSQPVRISETVISYYFHSIVLADLVELNYMSNISPA